MSPAFRSLLIKEWSERRRLFLFGLGLMTLYWGLCIAYELEYRTRAFGASFSTTCTAFGGVAAVLLAMSTATGEYTQRSLRFSASLPVSLKNVAWARLLGAWGCIAGVIAIGALLMTPLLASGVFEQAALRTADYASAGETARLPNRPNLSRIEAVGFLWTTASVAVISAVQLVTLIALVGTFCRSEGTVGFVGAIVVLLASSLTAIRSQLDASGLYFLSDWIGSLLPGTLAINWGYQDLDGSHYTDLELAPHVLCPLVINLALTSGMGAWFARRYGCRLDFSQTVRVGRTSSWIPRLPNLLSRLGIRWHFRLIALTWLNARQSIPLCLAGLTMAALLTCIGLSECRGQGTFSDRWAGELSSNTWFVGMLWGAIVAVGIFSSELKPELGQFWRSRPISPAVWFWMKFAVGLIALLTTLDLIPACLSRASPYQPDSGQAGIAYAACIPLLHTLIYALAVAAICRLRRPLPAAITALLLYFAFDQFLESIPVYPRLSTLGVYNQLYAIEFRDTPGRAMPVDLMAHGYPLVYGLVVVGIVGAIVVARRAVSLPRAGEVGLWAALLVSLCPTSNARGAEPSTVAEVMSEISQREASTKNIHVRVSRRFLQTAASFEDHPIGRWRRSPKDREQHKIYEYFNRPPRRAWTEFDMQGQVVSKTVYDGRLQMRYEAGQSGSRQQGSVLETPQPPEIPFLTPEHHLASLSEISLRAGMALQDRIGALPPDAFHWREVDGERLLDFEIDFKISGVNEHATPSLYEHRIQATLNVSRNCWPIRTQHEFRQAPNQQPMHRTVVTAHGWIGTGPIAYPKAMHYQRYQRSRTHPDIADELVLFTDQECDFELVEINPEIPDSVFASPFPPGAIYSDSRDRQHYEIDAAGKPQPYSPKPRGLRGAVLGYYILWITAAVIYWTRGAQRINRKSFLSG